MMTIRKHWKNLRNLNLLSSKMPKKVQVRTLIKKSKNKKKLRLVQKSNNLKFNSSPHRKLFLLKKKSTKICSFQKAKTSDNSAKRQVSPPNQVLKNLSGTRLMSTRPKKVERIKNNNWIPIKHPGSLLSMRSLKRTKTPSLRYYRRHQRQKPPKKAKLHR